MVVLDASAVLALLLDEPGAAKVEEHLADGVLLSVNLEEVVGALVREGMPIEAIERAVAPLALPVMAFTEEMAWTAAAARPRLPPGLGLADRCCLAAAAVLTARVVTADSLWTAAADLFGVEVVLAR